MAVTNDWGEASVNNTNGYGKGAINNTIRWGKIYASSASGDTNIGTAVTPSFSNTLSTRFDGVDDFASLSSTTNLRPTDAEINADGFSLSVWVNWTSASGGVWANGGAQESGNYTGFSFIVVSDGRIIIRKGDGGGTSSSNRSDATAAAGSISAGSWTHLAFVLPSANKSTWKIYVNGVSKTLTTSGTGGAVSYSGTAAIGSWATNSFNGAIDECAVFNTELSASDVTTIYNSGVPNDLTGTSGLVSWWRMGDGDTYPTITDNQGSNNGTMTNMSSGNFISNVPTFNSRSILLDGVDDTVNLGTPTNLRFERTDSFSFSCWVNPANADFHAVFTNSDTGSNYRGYYFQIKDDNTLSLFLRNNLTASGRIIITSTATVTTGSWNHIAFTYDGSSTGAGVKLYINGVASTTSSTGSLSATISSSNTIYLGSRNAADNFLQGGLDECAVFNTELSASEISNIYGTGAPTDISGLSPVSWWRCGDGDNSPTLIDRGSGSNNGTMTNFTTFSTDVPT